jgi:hypothetical protein
MVKYFFTFIQNKTLIIMENLLEKLQAPMDYKWRVQSVKFNKASCVAYIDARQVMDRLDEVLGIGNWQDSYEIIGGNLFCHLSVKIGDEWVVKSDCGTESNVEKEKGQASDAFKRAAVKLGIGRFLYNLEIIKLETDNNTPIYNGKKLYGDMVSKACNYLLEQKTKVKA